jgi:hypothetical protein
MKRGNLLAVVGACICGAGLMLVAFPDALASANDPPASGCQAVTKQEYDSAKKQRLLRTRYSTYVRTGGIGRRHYWYCNA